MGRMIYRKSRRHKSRDTLRFVISCCLKRNIDSFQQIGFESKMYNDKNQTGYNNWDSKKISAEKYLYKCKTHIVHFLVIFNA